MFTFSFVLQWSGHDYICPPVVMVMWFGWVILGGEGSFSQEHTPEGHTETHKSLFFPYKQISGRNGDYEWTMLSYYVIYYEKFRKDMQRTEKEALNFGHIHSMHVVVLSGPV